MSNSEEYFYVSARGTLVEIPMDIAKKCELFDSYITGNYADSKMPFKLNYDADVVNNLVDYLSEFYDLVDYNKIKYISNFLCIPIDKSKLIDKSKSKVSNDSIMDELKKIHNKITFMEIAISNLEQSNRRDKYIPIIPTPAPRPHFPFKQF